MKSNSLLTYLNLRGVDIPVGRLELVSKNGRDRAAFRYDDGFLKRKDVFALGPSPQLSSDAQRCDVKGGIFPFLTDCLPGIWGRVLISRYEMQAAHEEERVPRQLSGLDYLLAVNDFSRQGALRFKSAADGEFLTAGTDGAIPPLTHLPKLLAASESVLDDSETYADLRELLIPGSSLGGARPKASVIDNDGDLCIAKFPKRDDGNSNVLLEACALTLAGRAGLHVQSWSLQRVLDKPVLLLKRFDRAGSRRIPFVSAMTMFNASDGESGEYSYLDLAEVIRKQCRNVAGDLREMWSRILFSVLISNTDDHLRNHGFIRTETDGWQLSPLYDVNPSIGRTEYLQLNIDEFSSFASVDLVMSVAGFFGLSGDESKAILERERNAVREWRAVAKSLGLSAREISRMEVAFKV